MNKKIDIEEIPLSKLSPTLTRAVGHDKKRLGALTSVDGKQLAAVVLDPKASKASLYLSDIDGDSYPSLTPSLAAAHWFERSLHDLFEITPDGHPRLKPALLNERCDNQIAALLPRQLLALGRQPDASGSDGSGSRTGNGDHSGNGNGNGNGDRNRTEAENRTENRGRDENGAEHRNHEGRTEAGSGPTRAAGAENSHLSPGSATNSGRTAIGAGVDAFAAQQASDSHHYHRDISYLHVNGEGIYEIAVGPVHAGIIEPGHFRFNCLGEIIVNLEIRLGYLHRGVEKRLTEVPFKHAHFLAEAAASDTTVGNALSHAVALESLLDIEVPERAEFLRTIALEIERLAMHIADVGGMAVDLGALCVASSLSRLRGSALRLAELLSGSRFMRGYVVPGGVSSDPRQRLSEIKVQLARLRKELSPFLSSFMSNAVVYDRTRETGKVSGSLALDFGLVGVAARASGIEYDARRHFRHGVYPLMAPPVVTETQGDVYARVSVRVREIATSIEVIDSLLDAIATGPIGTAIPDRLPGDAVGIGVVESFRGELLHLIFTDERGSIKRYHIKDASANNWTGLAIAVRNNLLADFPICNKSFSLSYSGHDL